jgi:two-component system nitrate/nitrite response regulator NarL
MKHHLIPTLIVAADELSRAGLVGILAGARYKPIASKGGWDAAVVSGKQAPTVVILILSGEMAENVVSTKIEAMAAQSKVVVLADRCDAQLVKAAICAGAVAYLPRSISPEALLQALDLVLEGEIIFPASVARVVVTCADVKTESNGVGVFDRAAPAERTGRLSSREVEILRRLVQGESNKQIGRNFDISETTVKVHVKAILRKLRVSNRTQAAVWGLDHLSDLTDVAIMPPNVPNHIPPQALLIPGGTPVLPASVPRNGNGRSIV